MLALGLTLLLIAVGASLSFAINVSAVSVMVGIVWLLASMFFVASFAPSRRGRGDVHV